MTTEEKQRALVTGGSSGIGLAVAERLLMAGWSVAICGRDRARLDEAAATLGPVETIRADLGSPTEARAAVVSAAQRMAGLDAVVNAAGIIGNPQPLEQVSDAEWSSVLGVNLLGPIATTTAALPYLRERSGSVVNIASINAIQAEPWMAPYGTSKAGLVGFTKYAAIDLAQYGIRVNAVVPGWVRTPMAKPFFEEAGVVDRPMATNAMGRPAEPSEIAGVVAFLLSPDASYLTGECVVADGGHWINMRQLEPRPGAQNENE